MALSRILRGPDAPEGGGPLGDELVTISRAELDELRSRADVPVQPIAEVRDDPPSGPDDEELIASRRRAAEWERAFREALRDRELATALAGRPLVAGGAAQLVKLWRDDFDVIEEDGEFRVVARDGRAASQVVADRLTGPDYAHFCPPTSRGGTASRVSNRPAAPGVPPPPRTMGEEAILRWREAAAARTGEPSGPAGLRRR